MFRCNRVGIPWYPMTWSILTIAFPQRDEKGTGPIQPETLARHVHVARRESRKNSAGNPSFATSSCFVASTWLILAWQLGNFGRFLLSKLSILFHRSTALRCYAISLAMRSAKPTLGRLFAMMDLRRHLARIAPSQCSLTSLESRAFGGWWGGDTSGNNRWTIMKMLFYTAWHPG